MMQKAIYDEGHADGYEAGRTAGYDEAKADLGEDHYEGYVHEDELEEMLQAARDDGFANGHEEGYDEGRDDMMVEVRDKINDMC